MDDLRQLRQRVEVTKQRYREEIERERRLFEARSSACVEEDFAERHHRLMEQHARVMEAFTEYHSAVDAYLNAGRVSILRRE